MSITGTVPGAGAAEVAAIEAKLDDAAHGLAALKALIDAVEGKLDDPGHGLANLKVLIDAIETKLDDAGHGLAALGALLNAIKLQTDLLPLDPASEALVEAAITAAHAATDGLIVAVGALATAIKAQTDLLPLDPASESAVEAAITAAHAITDGKVDAVESKLDDGTIGLAALKTILDAILVDTGTTLEIKLDTVDGIVDAILVDTSTTLEGKLDIIAGYLDTEIAAILAAVDTEVAAIKAVTDNLPNSGALTTLTAYVDELETRLSAARAGYLDNINQAGLLQVTAARAALLDQITAARLAELDAANIPADTDSKVKGRVQIFEKSITSAANAGDTVVATVTTQPCLIESVVIHADAAQTADMTSCGIFGGAGKVVTFISAADAVQANLNAADKQVAWTGAVRLAATKTIVISLVGTGATAVDLTIVVKYRASVSGGYLA